MSQVIDANIGGNSRVFFVRGDRTAIVDAGYPGDERKILKALKVAGIPRDQVSLLVATHAHIDHYGSLRELKAALNVPVMAGWPDAGYMEKGENVPAGNLPEGASSAVAPGPGVPAVKADVIVTGDMSLFSYGIDARVLTTPGHTSGSLSVLAADGDCVTGDFLAGLYTGEPELIRHSLRKLADGGARYFYPSHTPGLEASAVFNQFLF
jgi:glyoxylase-like metal-dependent hydrolase (beta-lactamase superfamily II)